MEVTVTRDYSCRLTMTNVNLTRLVLVIHQNDDQTLGHNMNQRLAINLIPTIEASVIGRRRKLS